MTDAEVLDAYDLDERRFSSIPGMRREEGPRTIRHVPFAGGDGCVIWSALDAATADAAIDAEIERYRAVRRDFEWKVFGHDAPRDLKARLEARGFEAGEVECLCVLDLDDVRPAPPDPPIALIDNPADLEAVGLVRDAVWGADERGHMDQLAAEMKAVGDRLRVYVAHDGGRPASVAWLRMPDGSRFASLWGGSTLPEHRGRGLYRALVAARAAEARRRGYRWLTIDAGPMSLPIVRRLGFRPLTGTWPLLYRTAART